MRQIKFRAWVPSWRKMIDDSFYISQRTGLCFITDPEGFDNGDKVTMYDCGEEEPILMQYTGLKDKNGIEIYEGDCDRVGNVVEFSNGSWCLNGDRPLYGSNFTIAGNIYQNENI